MRKMVKIKEATSGKIANCFFPFMVGDNRIELLTFCL